MIALVKEEQFARLVGALGRPDLAADPRFADFATRAGHAAPLGEIIGAIFPTDTTAGWLARLRAADILADRVNGFDDWLADPHIVATGGAIAVDQPGMGTVPHPAHPRDFGRGRCRVDAGAGYRRAWAGDPRRTRHRYRGDRAARRRRRAAPAGAAMSEGFDRRRHRLADNRWFEDLADRRALSQSRAAP